MKAFIISLSKISSSSASSKKVLAQLLEYGFDAELFEGTYGWDAPELFQEDGRRIAKYGIKVIDHSREEFKEKYPQYVLPPDAVYVGIREELNQVGKMMRPGVIGCFYSHYRLWKKCIELNEPIFIFEDDVIFERNYIPVTWEDVLLVCLGKDAHNNEFYSPLIYDPQGDPEAIPLRNTSMPGAVGYGLTPQGAKKLVEAYKTEFLPADTAMNQFVVKLECHNYIMGRAARDEDGKQSLTTSGWDTKEKIQKRKAKGWV